MVKLYEGGAYLLHGTEVIADAPDALAAVKSKTGIETTKEAAAKVVKKELENKGVNLHGKLDKMLGL